MRTITARFVIAAIQRRREPHFAHFKTSTAKTRPVCHVVRPDLRVNA
jgi:hypothetical protein